jgi:carbamoyl-phosphate synthase small subunit
MESHWKLVLEDGAVYRGVRFGADREMCGEVVFNTGMTGYVEGLSDPSYRGQILVLTYPLIGNYGVPRELIQTGLPHPFESTGVQVLGLVVSRYEPAYSHHAADRSLGSWLKEYDLPALSGVDTRGLTRKLREQGTMRGKLCGAQGDDELPTNTYDIETLVDQVSRPGTDRFDADAGSRRLLMVDCGAKHNIVRSLLKRGVNVTRVHYDYDFNADDLGADGLFLSNGPGDPTDVPRLIERVRRYLDTGKPVFGICLGHQILALAAGGSTYRLPYGHRSQNQPVVERLTSTGYITSQNHGYGVDASRLPKGFYEWFVNVNDGTNEGIRHSRKPWMSVQFHPEAYPGPVETSVLFDEFVQILHEE